jgi:YidC/Oxa1 family membrane protein insertase
MQRWSRMLILVAMFVTGYLLILAWQKDYGGVNATSTTKTPAVATVHATNADIPSAAPTATAVANSDVPVAPQVSTTPVATAGVAATQTGLIEVQTDVYRLWIDPKGGDVVRTELLKHLDSKHDDKPFVLLEQDGARTYVAQSGLIGANGPDAQASGRPLYQAQQTRYTLGAGQTELVVPLVFQAPNNVTIVKTFVLKAGEYPIQVGYRIDNRGTQPWQGQMYGQLKRDNSIDPSKNAQGMMGIATYLGGAWGSPAESYNKLAFDEFQEEALNQQVKGGWIGIVQHYFVSAWIPNAGDTVTLQSRHAGGTNVIGFVGQTVQVAPNQQVDLRATLYAGPKIQSELKSLAEGLNKTVDYGWLWPIAQLLFFGLDAIYKVIGNWGWAIIVLTVIVKIILFPLSAKSYRSMAKMRVIAPEMQRMKEEFGDDRLRFSQEMMALYRREQVNPLSGCLPLLLQMPIFLALYWVLMESVELRHAPWMLWINDLSAMDPWFVLPLIMGVTMYVQQMLNPQPTDPMQAKVLRLLPIIFTVFLLFFPAGLVLYWIVNNLLTIAQQWTVNQQIEKESAAKKSA